LVDAGASCRAKDKRGRNPIVIADSHGQGALVAFLATRAAQEEAKRPLATLKGDTEQQPTPVSAKWLALEALAEQEMPENSGDRKPGWLRELVVKERQRVMTAEPPLDKPLTEVYVEQEIPSFLGPNSC
jgi:hypothetical protein